MISTRPQQLLARYDQDERMKARFAGMRREVTEQVVRHVSLTGGEGFISYSSLTPTNADEVIQEQIAYFERLGQTFEWKHYEHDTPPDLLERLEAHGFDIGEKEALVALELAALPEVLKRPTAHDVRRLSRPAELRGVVAIETAVWGRDYTSLVRHLAQAMREHPERLSVYVAYVESVPASTAWSSFTEGSRFAGLWGGSTLPQYRGQGLYTALVGVRAQEAVKRGVQCLTVDASPMSRPILERFGFTLLTYTYPCKWHPAI